MAQPQPPVRLGRNRDFPREAAGSFPPFHLSDRNRINPRAVTTPHKFGPATAQGRPIWTRSFGSTTAHLSPSRWQIAPNQSIYYFIIKHIKEMARMLISHFRPLAWARPRADLRGTSLRGTSARQRPNEIAITRSEAEEPQCYRQSSTTCPSKRPKPTIASPGTTKRAGSAKSASAWRLSGARADHTTAKIAAQLGSGNGAKTGDSGWSDAPVQSAARGAGLPKKEKAWTRSAQAFVEMARPERFELPTP